MRKENAKEEVLKTEGNAYFQRNLKNGGIETAAGCRLFDEFLEKTGDGKSGMRVLEVGCCYGYNLFHLCGKYGFEGYGIEPSEEAADYGNNMAKKKDMRVVIQQGTADELPYPPEYFDIVMLAFCMFWVDRKYALRAVSEADRVLKCGGVIAAWDFDTRIPYLRKNIHNDNVPTYKCDLASFFLGNPQYYLAEKRPFSHAGLGFHKKIQERAALHVLYKECLEDAYVFRD